MLRHMLITASLTALFLTALGSYYAYEASIPIEVAAPVVQLGPVDQEFMDRVETANPALARNPTEVINAVEALCPTIRSGAEEAYKPMIQNALNRPKVYVDKAQAAIIASAARQTICKVV